MACKYYAKLFREYCIADLSRYKVILIGMQATSTLQEPRRGAVAFSMARLIVLHILNPKRRMARSGCGGARRRRWLQARGSLCAGRGAVTCGTGSHPSRCAMSSRQASFVCTSHRILQTHRPLLQQTDKLIGNDITPEMLLIYPLAGAVRIHRGRRAEGSTGEAAAVPEACTAAQLPEEPGSPQGELLLCLSHGACGIWAPASWPIPQANASLLIHAPETGKRVLRSAGTGEAAAEGGAASCQTAEA